MTTKKAKIIAAEWIKSNWQQYPGFTGAFFRGSINVTQEEAPWPKSSDIDITVIAEVPRGLSHVHHKDLLLEIYTNSIDDFDTSFEGIISDFRRAIHFYVNSIILDPTGQLQTLHKEVLEQYSYRKWVIKRCQGAEKLATGVLSGMWEKSGFGTDTKWGAVLTLYYAAFVAAEMLALADLRNPTVRRAFVVSRQVLESCDRLNVQELLLEALGARELSRDNVNSHFELLKVTIKEASRVLRKPFFFSEKLKVESRSHILAGVQEIIDMGLHRESVFWIQFMLSIAQRAIESDAPNDSKKRHLEEYLAVLDDLDLQSTYKVEAHIQLLRELLPKIWEAVEVTMSRNTDIID